MRKSYILFSAFTFSLSSSVVLAAYKNQAPVVSFLTPTNSTTLQEGDSLGVVVSASDNDGKIARCSLAINGSAVRTERVLPYEWGTANANNSDAALLNLASGEYTLRTTCTDNSGLSSSSSVSVTVAAPAIAPQVSFASPSANTTLQEGDSLGVVVSASDSDGDIANCSLAINGAPVRTENFAPYEWGTANTNDSDSALLNLASGEYTLQTTCTDNDGLASSSSVSVTVAAPASAPQVSFASPSANTTLQEGDSLGVVVSASDSDGTIANCSLAINGAPVRTENLAPYEWGTANTNDSDSALLNLASGEYTLQTTCTDNDGLASSSTVAVTVAAPAPTTGAPQVSFASPSAGTTLQAGDSLGVVVSASDSDGTIANCSLAINGSPVRTENFAPYEWGTANTNDSDNALLNLASGEYTLQTTCTDNDGIASSSTVTVAVSETDSEPTTSSGTVQLSWNAPTQREDGSPLALAEIAGYEIYLIGESSGDEVVVPVEGGAILQQEVSGLGSDTYHASIVTIDSTGLASQLSNVRSFTLTY